MKLILFLAVATGLAAPIPKGFLLYEKAAAQKDANPETSWQVSAAKTARFTVNPCNKQALGQAGRTAAKTITYTAVPDYAKSEQVILYASTQAAQESMTALRTALTTCAVRKDHGSASYRFKGVPAALGDEALLVLGQFYQGRKPAIGGERAVVARRANAIVIYSQSGEWGRPAGTDYARQQKDAKAMLAKICAVAACD
ncbi:hypothetical protein [Nonomuraea sp. NPDC050310]|uniref:hypothetical protein n=1 Tax=Nonomuraea sp. NPDC050310 TaxID=3154935 RepID=UPI0033C5255E